MAITLLIMEARLIAYHFWQKKIADVLITIIGGGIIALVFVGTDYAFTKIGRGDVDVEPKRHDSVEENYEKL